MDSTNQQFGFASSLPQADCALVNPACHFGTSQQLQHQEPAVSCEQPMFSHPQLQQSQHQLYQHEQPQLQPQHHMHEYQEPQLQLREHQLPLCMYQQSQPQLPSQQYGLQYPQLHQHQLQQQQHLAPQEEASPVTGDSMISMAFALATGDQPSVAAPQQAQIQAQSGFLPAVNAPPQQQICEHRADVLIASLDQAAVLPGGQQQNPLAGAAALVQDEARSALPATGSFGEHIGRAFMEAEENRLHLHDLYEYFLNKFSGLDPEDSKWKGSVRNKLSTSKCFMKRCKKVDGKKGGTWSVRDEYLENFRNGIFHSSTRKKKPLTEEEENAQLEHILPKSCMVQYADVLRNYTHVTPISSEQVLEDLVRKYGKKVICG
ncbi:hypothetical protein CAPTEDRAFT_191728 [Capitella teleta]|uniref:Fork-head domain-containing protein n=1 Tax=Capitella teleta TaxID=283909 RepID=R7U1M0_CAPTE|nr:hypothetical protein CAPTEDRAFT_191728 [Capitella teleta]|eukprot:ELT97085.1 hypothetical protein CAPTEDRAFT_191728 [Capitella teleta]